MYVSIPKGGIEKLVDNNSYEKNNFHIVFFLNFNLKFRLNNRNIFYGIYVFIQVDGLYVTPTDYLYKSLFLKGNLQSISNGTLTFFNPNTIATHRTVLAFKFYFNLKIPRNYINLIAEYIKESFEKTTSMQIFVLNLNIFILSTVNMSNFSV